MDSDVPFDPRLTADTAFVADLPLSRLLLMNDCRFPWLILVPRKIGASELFDLDEAARETVVQEIAQISKLLKSLSRCEKINVGALGNLVPQLHIHVVGRRRTDDAWPGPVWGVGQSRPYTDSNRSALIAAIKALL